MAPASAFADPEDALNFALGTAVRYDNNLFRLPSGSPSTAPGRSSKSDVIYTTHAGIRIDKPYSLQRFQLDLMATDYKYKNNDQLDFTALDYRTAWLWSLSPRLTGSLSADRTQQLENFADLQNNNVRNRRINESQRFSFDWLVDGGWHAIGGANHVRSEASSGGSQTATGNYDEDTIEGGIRYVSPASNSLSAVLRRTHGDFLGRSLNLASVLDTGYDQRETELQSVWQVTGHSLLDARLGYVDRSYDNFSQRDYSGVTGALSYRWTPTGKLQFTLATGRNLVTYQEAANSYYTSNYLSLTPAWLVSDKTTIRLRLDVSRNDYHGSVTPVSSTREDTIRSAQLGIVWRPLRTVTVDGYLTREQRSSNLSGFSYHDSIAGISASLLF